MLQITTGHGSGAPDMILEAPVMGLSVSTDEVYDYYHKSKSTDYNIVLRAPAAEYTVSAAYSSSAPGGSTQRAVLALDYCHDLHSTMFSVDRLTKNPAFLVVAVMKLGFKTWFWPPLDEKSGISCSHGREIGV